MRILKLLSDKVKKFYENGASTGRKHKIFVEEAYKIIHNSRNKQLLDLNYAKSCTFCKRGKRRRLKVKISEEMIDLFIWRIEVNKEACHDFHGNTIFITVLSAF